MGHVAVLDLAPDLGDLEPVQVPQGLPRPVQAVADRGLDALGRGADDLRHPVCAVSHDPSVVLSPLVPPGGTREGSGGTRSDHGIVTAMVPGFRGWSGAHGSCAGDGHAQEARAPAATRAMPASPSRLLLVQRDAGARGGGYRLGPGQREVAGVDVSRTEAAQLRLFLGAQILRERAAGAEPAAGGRGDGAGQLARYPSPGP